MTFEALTAAADMIAARSGRSRHDVAVVLGSGLSDHAGSQPGAVTIPFDEVPGFPLPRVAGHAGSVVSAEIAGRPVLFFAGRVHSYEGWTPTEVVFGVRTAVLTGAGTVVLTNAAGGCGPAMTPGTLAVIRDHINLTARSPLIGVNDDRLGPRFPDMSTVYTPALRERAHAVGTAVGVDLAEGVYASFLGPSYETPAEVEMARRAGADLVGMSTALEAIAARHMGAAVLGISLVTNLAAGISPTPLSHEEVTATAAAARERFTRLLDGLLPTLVTR